MTSARRILCALALGGAGGALAGALTGYGLSLWVPDYLRAAFGHRAVDLSSAQIGIGVGLLQGGAVGLALALGVQLLLILQRLPRERSVPSPWLPRVIFGFSAFLVLSLCTGTGFLMGGILQETRSYAMRSERLLTRARRALQAVPKADLRPTATSDGGVVLLGRLTQAEEAPLREALRREFGYREAAALIADIPIDD